MLTERSYRRINNTIADRSTLKEGVYWMIIFMIPPVTRGLALGMRFVSGGDGRIDGTSGEEDSRET
jgi:hypothetical protein